MTRDLEAKTLFVATLVGIAHIISGVAVLMTADAVNVTPLATLHLVANRFGYTNGFAGAVLILAGMMAVIGGNLRYDFHRWFYGTLFLPQQVLLVLQVVSICTALGVGKYPDGYIPVGGAWFILTDQIWAWVLAVCHSIWLAAFIYGKGTVRGISGST
jgi:hypothetical protein